MLASISNNEEILGMLTNNIEEDHFDDLLDDPEFKEI